MIKNVTLELIEVFITMLDINDTQLFQINMLLPTERLVLEIYPSFTAVEYCS
jgi:hypothetical protein